MEDILTRLSPQTAQAAADHLARSPYARIYDGLTTWIIKPPEERHWTQAAALNDADLIFQDHMEGEQTNGNPQ